MAKISHHCCCSFRILISFFLSFCFSCWGHKIGYNFILFYGQGSSQRWKTLFSQLFYAFMNYHNCKPFFYFFFFLGKGGNQLKLRCKQKIPSLHPRLSLNRMYCVRLRSLSVPMDEPETGRIRVKGKRKERRGCTWTKTQSLNELQ